MKFKEKGVFFLKKLKKKKIQKITENQTYLKSRTNNNDQRY